MAGRILNRRTLREHAHQIEGTKAIALVTAVVAVPPKKQPKAKTPAAPKVKKTRAKKEPPRLRARWGVFDSGMKQVAIFDYNQRAAADERLADLLAKKKGLHFLQIVKDAMPEPEPVEALNN
jgi:hypothetical protein